MSQNARIYRSQAVILSRRDHGEADRLLTLFTPKMGKQEWIAKGIRKTTSRKAGHLELFAHATVLVAKARTWDIITEAATVESFRHLRTNLELIAETSYVAELVSSFTEQDDENLAIWDLLLLALRVLDEQAEEFNKQIAATDLAQSVIPQESPNPLMPLEEVHQEATVPPEFAVARATLLLRWFELRLLGMSGFQPQLFFCLNCNESIEPVTNFLSLEDGGIFCPQCAIGRNDIESIESDILKLLRHLQRSSWPEIQHLRVQPMLLLATETILHRYLLTVLERQLKSILFLRKLQNALPQIV